MNLKYNTRKNRVHLEVMKCQIEKTLDDFMWLWYMYIVMENYNDFDTIYVLILSMLRLSSLQYPTVLWIITHTLYVCFDTTYFNIQRGSFKCEPLFLSPLFLE